MQSVAVMFPVPRTLWNEKRSDGEYGTNHALNEERYPPREVTV